MKPELLRYKQEILESGLSQRQWYRLIYLRSAHWGNLKREKFKHSGRVCQIQGKGCQLIMKLDVHHLEYRSIYDVTLDDLQVVCRSCHKKLHDHHQDQPKKKKKVKSEADAKREFKTKMFLKFVEKSCASFDGSTTYSFGNVEYTVGAMKGFIAFKPEVANKFINFAMDKMKEAKNLSGETRRRLIALKCRDTVTKSKKK